MARRNGVSIETAIYNNFKGVDFTTDSSLVAKNRSPMATNMIADVGGRPEKRPGWRTLQTLTGSVNGLYSGMFDGVMKKLAHVGTKLYLWDETGTPTELYDGLENAKSTGIYFGGKIWILAGEYLVYDGTTVKKVSDDAHVPTTVIAREPTGGGTTLDSLNLIGQWRKNDFQTDGTALTFQLDAKNLDTVYTVEATALTAGTTYYLKEGDSYYTFTPGEAAAGTELAFDFEGMKVTVGSTETTLAKAAAASGTDLTTLSTVKDICKAWVWGTEKTEGTDFTVDRAEGTITFTTAPTAPASGKEDGLSVQFPKTVTGYADKIRKCRIIFSYGVGTSDRLIFSGNPDLPNQDWTSELNDPTYIPDLSYSNVGIEGVPIMGYCRLGEYLGIIKSDDGHDTTVFVRSASTDSSGNAVFPLKQAIAGVGAVAMHSFGQLLDEPLFLSGTGVYAVTSNVVTSQRICQNRSYYVDGALTKEPNLENACGVEWMGMYLISINGHVYILDGRQQKTYRSESLGDYVYECYYWENVPATAMINVKSGAEEILYFGTADGKICRFNTDRTDMTEFSDDGAAITAVWATKADDDGDSTVLKTMIKKGCAVTLKPFTRSSAKILFRTDRDCAPIQAQNGTMDIFDWTDIDFSRFTFNSNDGPQEIMFNAKVKKYKRLQIVIKNDAVNEGFGVFGITKHYVTGNFAK